MGRPKEYYTKRRLYRKLKAVEYMGGVCEDCGFVATTENYIVFDFHHIDPSEKDLALGSGLNLLRSWKKITDELDKCELLCSNCHRLLHGQEKSGYGHTRELRKELK